MILSETNRITGIENDRKGMERGFREGDLELQQTQLQPTDRGSRQGSCRARSMAPSPCRSQRGSKRKRQMNHHQHQQEREQSSMKETSSKRSTEEPLLPRRSKQSSKTLPAKPKTKRADSSNQTEKPAVIMKTCKVIARQLQEVYVKVKQLEGGLPLLPQLSDVILKIQELAYPEHTVLP